MLVGPEAPEAFKTVRDRVTDTIAAADWRVVSTNKTDRLLRKMLFERVAQPPEARVHRPDVDIHVRGRASRLAHPRDPGFELCFRDGGIAASRLRGRRITRHVWNPDHIRV